MDRLEELRKKYDAPLQQVAALGLKLTNLHVQDNKLFIGAVAPSEAVKNQIWDSIKKVDPGYGDLIADIKIDPSMAPKAAPAPAAPSAPAEQRYTVVAGDTLSAISKRFYGDAKHYPKIFEANKDILKDPDHIKPGQSLRIPPA